MSKSFEIAFQEWKNDHSYEISDDIGTEFYDEFECPGPTPDDRSLTTDDEQNSTQKIFD